MKAARDYKEWLIQDLKDPKEAEAYLNAALEDPDPRVLLIALRDVAAAQGNMSAMAKRCGLHRTSLYRITSKRGNPSLESFLGLIRCLGLHLKLERRSRSRLARA